MHWGSRAFVFVVFFVLAASFWMTTISLYLEFADHSKPIAFNGEVWFTLLTHYSDLFIFFPLFGTVALIAFYTPACAFVDMYWHDERNRKDLIPQARIRFTFWVIVVAAFSFAISYAIQLGEERSIWQLKPSVLAADEGQACSDNQCSRVSFLDGLNNVRRVSRERITVTDLQRVCKADIFAPPKELPQSRYCAPSTNFEANDITLKDRWLDDPRCCIAQRRFDAAIKKAHETAANRSDTDTLQQHLWPLNIFFLMTLLAISILLALRRPRIERFYADYARSIDRGVIVGVLAMAFLAVMNRGFLEATQLLHGVRGAASTHRGPDTFLVLFTIWALLILFSFVHPANKQAELTSRFLGVVFSVLFVFNADTITNYSIRYLGAGAGLRSLVLLSVVALALLALLAGLARITMTEDDDKPSDERGGDPPAPKPISDGPRERAG